MRHVAITLNFEFYNFKFIYAKYKQVAYNQEAYGVQQVTKYIKIKLCTTTSQCYFFFLNGNMILSLKHFYLKIKWFQSKQ